MFFSKKQKLKLEYEIQNLQNRLADQDLKLHALANHLGWNIQYNYNNPKFNIVKMDDTQPRGPMGLVGAAPFSL